jgi:L,D-transpeptidase YcbB
MKRRLSLVSVCVLVLASTSLARAVDAVILPPDLPVAMVDVSDALPLLTDLPALPDIIAILSPEDATASLPATAPSVAPVPAFATNETSSAAAPAEKALANTPSADSAASSAGEPVQAQQSAATAHEAIDIAPPDLPQVGELESQIAPDTKSASISQPVEAQPPAVERPIVPEAKTARESSPPPSALAPVLLSRLNEALTLPRLAERERREIAAAYTARAGQPYWIDTHGWTAQAKQLVATISNAPAEGLFSRDYPLPAFVLGDVASLSDADIRLTALAVLYARDARGARIEPRRLSNLITPKLSIPSTEEVIERLTAAQDSGQALASFNPQHASYQRLRGKLAELRKGPKDGDGTPMVLIPEGPPLRVGMRDERVPLVRARLGLGPSDAPVFDQSIAVALAEFQKQAGLPANGVLGRQTVAALGSPAAPRQEADLIAQMERWRWLPPELGTSHIMVNIPEFQVRLFRDGRQVHQTRAIVGKPETPTPIFSDMMDHLVVNPSWFVPPSIMKKEFLPNLALDPDYAAKRGYEVIRRGNNITVRQPPGERNALGNIKFMFPNNHAVYLHDTPNRRLFATERRSYSHGCVRVDQPFALAEQVLGKDAGWSAERVRRMVGSGERTVKLPQKLPIHLVYNTHVVDESGEIRTFADLYGFHRLVRQALGFRG